VSLIPVSSHRSTRLDRPTRVQRLQGFIEPVKAQWSPSSLSEALDSYEGFCHLTALNRAQEYLARRRIYEISDWGSVILDAEGLEVQAQLEQQQTVSSRLEIAP
jgi:exportin-5